jgi:hypothetical protein
MKQLFLFSICVAIYCMSNAQNNVGIGTQTPHASAALEVSSTTRGLLAPRMTTAQRNAIASPAKGLLVYDSDLNGLYHYNGSSWAAVGGSGGGFSLPFEANVNLNVPTFQIQNAGSGDVLFLGAGAGSAINAYNTGNAAAISVSATNGFGVYAQSFNSIPVFALSNNVANTLPAMRANNTGGGVGLHATASNNNGILGVSSAANRSGVRGEATGTNGIGVYGETTSNNGAGVAGFNAGGIGVQGVSNNGNGVYGETQSGLAAVYGEHKGTAGSGVRGVAHHADGRGVSGQSANGTGVSGYSNSGVGVMATSPTGYALETSGKLKIAGGNTNPAAGAVLTSVDASGNAVWANTPKVGFKAFSVSSGHEDLPEKSARRIQYGTESFDLSNNYALLTSGATPTGNSSVFTAPVSGVYHFDIGCRIFQSDLNALFNDIESATLSLMRNRNGVETTLASIKGNRAFAMVGFSEVSDHANLHISISELLQAGDRIYVNIIQISGTDIRISGENNWFSGVLVTPL